MKRLGLRTRLTVIYGGLFFIAGSLLVGVNYLLTARALQSKVIAKYQVGTVKEGAPTLSGDSFFKEVSSDVTARANDVLSELLSSSLVIMVLIGLFALVIGYLMADRALRPLGRVTETAQRLSDSNLHERIALEGPQDEVKRLADTFDGMLDRLHKSFDTQRRFIANASHELRTPLTINRTVLEVSLEEPAASPDLKALARALLGTNARHERLIEGLLLMAQSEQELTVSKPVDLEQIVRIVLEQVEAEPRKRRVTVHHELRSVMVEGDPLFLERCVFNLVENALKYNVKDGQVWVRVAREGDSAMVTVENTGPLVPPYEVDDLFEPFRRQHGDRIRSDRGSGLGLSIVRAILTAHGGCVAAVSRPDGGLVTTVRLPVL